MPLFANEIIIVKDGVQAPSPQIRNPVGVLEPISQPKIVFQEPQPVVTTLPEIAAVRHPDFIEKSSDYVYHMFNQ